MSLIVVDVEADGPMNLAKNQTNFTSPVTLIIGLNECLKLLQKEGLENAFERQTRGLPMPHVRPLAP